MLGPSLLKTILQNSIPLFISLVIQIRCISTVGNTDIQQQINDNMLSMPRKWN